MTDGDDQVFEKSSTVEVVMEAIRAVERRDLAALSALYHSDVEFVWPPGLPYSGRFKGSEIEEMTIRFSAIWGPLQPTETERRMDPEVVATSDQSVVVCYQWRAVDPAGHRFETTTIACYEVLDGQLKTARMFYDDHAGLVAFLNQADLGSDGDMDARG